MQLVGKAGILFLLTNVLYYLLKDYLPGNMPVPVPIYIAYIFYIYALYKFLDNRRKYSLKFVRVKLKKKPKYIKLPPEKDFVWEIPKKYRIRAVKMIYTITYKKRRVRDIVLPRINVSKFKERAFFKSNLPLSDPESLRIKPTTISKYKLNLRNFILHTIPFLGLTCIFTLMVSLWTATPESQIVHFIWISLYYIILKIMSKLYQSRRIYYLHKFIADTRNQLLLFVDIKYRRKIIVEMLNKKKKHILVVL